MSSTNSIPLSVLSDGIASQQPEGTPVTLLLLTNSPSVPIPMPPLLVDPHSSSDSAEIDAALLPHGHVFLSSAATPASSVLLWASQVPTPITPRRSVVLTIPRTLAFPSPKMDLSHHVRQPLI